MKIQTWQERYKQGNLPKCAEQTFRCMEAEIAELREYVKELEDSVETLGEMLMEKE